MCRFRDVEEITYLLSWRGSFRRALPPFSKSHKPDNALPTMPRENKRRGRRDEKKNEKKRKRREEAEALNSSKKQKFEDEADYVSFSGQQLGEGDGTRESVGEVKEVPFYGLLNEGEQEYFKRADEMLELNQFNSAEGKHKLSRV
jgi:hypothetical protein